MNLSRINLPSNPGVTAPSRTPRLTWPDTTRALGMFLVFWGHLLETPEAELTALTTADRYIYAFHMPLFFLLAGYFFRPTPQRFGELVVSKLKNRVVPVVFFTLLALPLWQHPDWWLINNVDGNTVHYHLWRLLRGHPNLNWPCWFLICLMVTELIAAELIPLLRTRGRILLAVPVAYATGRFLTDLMPESGVNLLETRQYVWFVQEAPLALSFYLCGYLLAGYGLPDRLSTRQSLAALLLSAAAFCLLIRLDIASYVFIKVNMSAREHSHWLYFPLVALSGSFAFILACRLLPATRLLHYIGQNSLPLIGCSGLFVHFFNRLLQAHLAPLASGWTLVALYALVAFASLLACLPFVGLLNRLVPKLIGKWR